MVCRLLHVACLVWCQTVRSHRKAMCYSFVNDVLSRLVMTSRKSHFLQRGATAIKHFRAIISHKIKGGDAAAWACHVLSNTWASSKEADHNAQKVKRTAQQDRQPCGPIIGLVQRPSAVF